MLVSDTAQWVGTVERKHGLFFTPHAVLKEKPGWHPFFGCSHLPTGFWPGAAQPFDRYDTLFADLDGGTEGAQLSALSHLPLPTALVRTGDRRYGEGGRGLHAFWKLTDPIDARTWTRLQLALAWQLCGDPCTVSPHQPMRVGGFAFPGRYQTLVGPVRTDRTLPAFFSGPTIRPESVEQGLRLLRTAPSSQQLPEPLVEQVTALVSGSP